MVEAAETNSQVSAILHDDDVYDFYDGIARQYGPRIESGQYDRLIQSLREAKAYDLGEDFG